LVDWNLAKIKQEEKKDIRMRKPPQRRNTTCNLEKTISALSSVLKRTHNGGDRKCVHFHGSAETEPITAAQVISAQKTIKKFLRATASRLEALQKIMDYEAVAKYL